MQLRIPAAARAGASGSRSRMHTHGRMRSTPALNFDLDLTTSAYILEI